VLCVGYRIAKDRKHADLTVHLAPVHPSRADVSPTNANGSRLPARASPPAKGKKRASGDGPRKQDVIKRSRTSKGISPCRTLGTSSGDEETDSILYTELPGDISGIHGLRGDAESALPSLEASSRLTIAENGVERGPSPKEDALQYSPIPDGTSGITDISG
jgi:hypothetical protein